MTTRTIRDRCYYRNCTTAELVDELSYGTNVDWNELAIAMCERLDTVWEEAREHMNTTCPRCGYDL